MSHAAAGEPSRSASSIVAETAKGYHILKIDGYSLTMDKPTGDYFKSQSFTVGGHRWCIRYYPNGAKPESAEYISLFLVLDESVAKAVKARYQFRFVDKVGEQPLKLGGVNSFYSDHGWGHSKFITREDLEKSKHLKEDDSFAVVVVVVSEFRTEEGNAEVAAPAFVSVPPSDLNRHLGELLLSERGADVVFQVGGETFAAHRCVVAARSPVFRAELLGTMKESDAGGVVRIDDMEASVFKTLLCFIYTDAFPESIGQEQEKDEDVMFQHLLVAADRYALERLKLICEDKLCRYIDVGTVATILALAEQHHCDGLKKGCFGFLSSPENLRAVVASDGFNHLSRSCPSVMEQLIAMLSNLVQ
ncbi:hypothetical protein ACP70R_019294 [Stipagrostis hirtigluma subsp. patula]